MGTIALGDLDRLLNRIIPIRGLPGSLGSLLILLFLNSCYNDRTYLRVERCNMNKIAKGTRFSRAVRKEHILHELRNSSSTWHTATSLSKLIGINPSSHMRGILCEMVEDGQLKCETWTVPEAVYFPSAIQRKMYALPHRAKEQPL